MRRLGQWWRTPPAAPIAAAWTWLVVGAGVVYLFVAHEVDGALQFLVAISVITAALLVARGAGLSSADLGLARRDVPSGLRWGATLGAAAGLAIYLTAVIPGLSSLFEDDRYTDVAGSELAFDVFVRIPIGTALFEELLFRGVLLGVLLRQIRPTVAVAVSAALFGLWHVASASTFAGSNAGVPDGGSWLVVPVTVLVTGVAGAFLAWLRIRSRSVIAPWFVHAAVNSSALVAAWYVAR
jgi:membrane protease YdiL (CAAX protease family)